MNTAFSSFEPAINPFALMTEPDAVLAAVQRSERLNGLRRQIFRPLDKPLIPCIDPSELDAFDREVDCADDVADRIDD